MLKAMFMFKKNKKMLEEFDSYLQTAGELLDDFKAALDYYFENGPDDHVQNLANEIHIKESRCDDIRRHIELEIFEKSLLPESREDIFLLLERLDNLPNQAEDILRTLWTQQQELPQDTHPQVAELAELGVKMFGYIREGVKTVLGRGESIEELLTKVDTAESVGDQIQYKLVAQVFAKDMAVAEKMLCRDAIREIGALCDMADDVALLLNIINVKRRV
ncbi:MAG: DUF47 family protein [Lentisphaeria bacterium]